MGEAKRRKAEIEELKRKASVEPAQWRRVQQDTLRVLPGIDPESTDPERVAALARLLHGMLIEAKTTGDIDPAVTLYHATITATVRGLSDIAIACTKGCSHCCHTWVSVYIPEALFIAKIIRRKGEAAIDQVRRGHQLTKDYDFDARDHHPIACPLLEQDLCSIYENRPMTCRMAASADAGVCGRTYHHLTNEDIPMPAMFMLGRTAYAVAMASGLRKANLPHYAYEFNAALTRALATEDAERRWLSGEDLFADIHRDPTDQFTNPPAQQLYEYAFK
jgi:Fe-S-cluster containining protein